jgi:DNA-binding MarR family transcriptional regulator
MEVEKLFKLNKIGLAMLIKLYNKKSEIANNLPEKKHKSKSSSKPNLLYVSEFLSLGFHYSNILINMKKLESLGLITTDKKPNTRERYVDLTPKGEELAKKLIEVLKILG